MGTRAHTNMLVPCTAEQAKRLFLRAVLVYRRCIAMHMLCPRALQRHVILVQATMANHVQEDHMRLFEVLNVPWIPGHSKAKVMDLAPQNEELYRGNLGFPKRSIKSTKSNGREA